MIEWIRHIVTSGLSPTFRLNPTWLDPDLKSGFYECETIGVPSGNEEVDGVVVRYLPNRDKAKFEHQHVVDSHSIRETEPRVCLP